MSGVYLHVPFCEKKCDYCAFPSRPMRAGDEEIFLESIERELALRGRRARGIDSLYIGGGTPSKLSSGAWLRMLNLLENSFIWADDVEVTVEANPSSLTSEKLMIWRDWRVTRISIGVQSFDDAELKLLGRLHDAITAADAVVACQTAGFSVSVDLMFGLPFGNLHNWARTLHGALSLRPSHISIYQLSIEPDTPFAGRGFDLPDGYDQYRYAQWYLPKKSFSQYEVASFARPGFESRHNSNYWADGEYIGIGPAAWGYENGTRYRNAPTLDEYAKRISRSASAVVFEERLEGERAARQAAVLSLRTMHGIDWKKFEARYGKIFADTIRDDLEKFPADLVSSTEKNSRLTAKGMRLGNSIWSEIVG